MTFVLITGSIMTISIFLIYRLCHFFDIEMKWTSLVLCAVMAFIVNGMAITMSPFLDKGHYLRLGILVVTAAAVVTFFNERMLRREEALAGGCTILHTETLPVEETPEPPAEETLLEARRKTPAPVPEAPSAAPEPVQKEKTTKKSQPAPAEKSEAQQAVAEAQEAAKRMAQQSEAEAKKKAEEEAKAIAQAKAEKAAKEKAARKAKAEAKKKAAEEAKAKAEAEAKKKAAEEAKAKAEAEAKKKAAEEAKAKAEAEAKKKAAEEAKAKAEAEAKKKAAEEAKAKAEAEAKKKAAEEAKAKAEAEAKKKAAEEAKAKAEEKARKKAEAKKAAKRHAHEQKLRQEISSMDSLDDILDFAYETKDKEPKDAIIAYHEAIARYADDDYTPFLVIELGNLYKEQANYSGAIATYKKALTMPIIAQNDAMCQEFTKNIHYLGTVQDILAKHAALSTPFPQIPGNIMQEIEDEFQAHNGSAR